MAADAEPIEGGVSNPILAGAAVAAASASARTNQLVLESHHKLLLAAKQNASDELEVFQRHHEAVLHEQAAAHEEAVRILREELQRARLEVDAMTERVRVRETEASAALSALRDEADSEIAAVKGQLELAHAEAIKAMREAHAEEVANLANDAEYTVLQATERECKWKQQADARLLAQTQEHESVIAEVETAGATISNENTSLRTELHGLWEECGRYAAAESIETKQANRLHQRFLYIYWSRLMGLF